MPLSTMRVAAIAALMVSGAGVAACGVGAALGGDKVRPDEFRIVTKAPLVIPPEYNVRPPRPGEPRPQELNPEQQARIAVLGEQYAARASDGEQLLVALTGGFTVDSTIRNQIDIEGGGVVRKPAGFVDRLIFWNDGDTFMGTETNAEMEDERLRRIRAAQAAVGEDGEVEINRRSGFKLPGL